jgi:hypothetical protein
MFMSVFNGMDTTKKKRGAPLGNKNALKNTLYSRLYTEEEKRVWKSAAGGRLQPEINLFKILIARTASLLKPLGENPAPSFRESLSMLYVVSMAIARLNSFYCTNEKTSATNDDWSVELFKRVGFTQDEIDNEIYGTAKRMRGGQVGNTNALKHGFYASTFKPEEIRKLEKMDGIEINDDLVLLRTLIKRTVISMNGLSGLDIFEYLRGIRVITFAGSCIEKLERTRRLVFKESTELENIVMNSLRELNKEDGYDNV